MKGNPCNRNQQKKQNETNRIDLQSMMPKFGFSSPQGESPVVFKDVKIFSK